MQPCNECGAEAGFQCDPSCPMYVDPRHAKRQADYDSYYAATVIKVMVPVTVRYHMPTDVVYSFDPPTIDDVEEAVRKHKG